MGSIRNVDNYKKTIDLLKKNKKVMENELLQFVRPNQIKAFITSLSYMIPIYEDDERPGTIFLMEGV
ncbi:MAG: hypothetical protein ILP07_06640 [Treponema sp.]|nr:hypothetical protein [Treponema sp.]